MPQIAQNKRHRDTEARRKWGESRFLAALGMTEKKRQEAEINTELNEQQPSYDAACAVIK